jgi:hypothetical protein
MGNKTISALFTLIGSKFYESISHVSVEDRQHFKWVDSSCIGERELIDNCKEL